MRIGIVVDSACDLPQEFLEGNKVVILPVTIHLGSADIVDQRNAEATLAFYRQHLGAKGDASSSPFSVEQIRELFLSRLVLDYDLVFCLTIAASRSPIHDNASKASLAILNDYKPIRAKAGVPGPFAMRVIDTQNLFAGQGVVTVEAVRMIKGGDNPNKIRERIDYLTQNTYAYMLPRDLFYLRTRAKAKGDRSVGLVSAFMGTALDIKPVLRCLRSETGKVGTVRHFDEGAARCFQFLGQRMKRGLLTRTVCLSYGGELAQMRKLPGYVDMLGIARSTGVEVFESVMSITGGINVGEGALAFAFAAEPHDFS